MTPTGHEWATFFAAVAAAVRAAGIERSIAQYEERWRGAKQARRGRWGER